MLCYKLLVFKIFDKNVWNIYRSLKMHFYLWSKMFKNLLVLVIKKLSFCISLIQISHKCYYFLNLVTNFNYSTVW